jgi:ABC-type glycerol-3-phosphate transport system substrate-binding protein
MLCISVLLLFWAGNVFNGSLSVSDPNQGRRPDEPAPEQKPGIKELTLSVSMDAKEFAVLTQLKQQFQSIHPDISIKLENLSPGTAYMKWKKSAQLGEAPDMMLLDNNWVAEFAALGYLRPVDSLLSSDLIAQQMEQVVNQVKWNGYMWAVPKDVDLQVMVYSSKRLTELGQVKAPVLSEDLIALHDTASKPDEGKYGIYIDFNDPMAFLALTKSLGGTKSQGKPGPVKLTEPAVSKSLESMLSGPKEAGKEDSKWLSKIFPASSAVDWKPWDLLQQGRLLGMLTTLSDYKLHAKEGIIMSALPLPRGEAVWKSAWLSGRSFVFSSRSSFPKESFEWIRELTSSSSNVKFWNEGFKLPSVLNSYLTGGIKNDPAVQSIASFMDKDDGLPKSPLLSRQLQQLASGLNQLWNGEISWKMFFEQTEQQWGNGQAIGTPSTAVPKP